MFTTAALTPAPQVLCDAISVVMTISVVLAVNLNLFDLFGHDLVSYHPLLFYYLLIMVSAGAESVGLGALACPLTLHGPHLPACRWACASCSWASSSSRASATGG
jgi:hypothetical protein